MNKPSINPDDPNNTNGSNDQRAHQFTLNKPNSVSNTKQSDNPFTDFSEQRITQQKEASFVELLEESRSWYASRGIDWLTTAIRIFFNNWLLWLGMSFTFSVLIIITGIIPFIGSFILSIMVLYFIAGMMVGCQEQVESDNLEFKHLFIAFKTHINPLLKLSVWYLIGSTIVFIPIIIFIVIGYFIFLGMLVGDAKAFNLLGVFLDNPHITASVVIIGVLLSLALYVPLLMSIWIAPALIVLHDIKAKDAIKMSFKGCLKNIHSFLIFWLVSLVSAIVFLLCTLGLGVFVIIPIIIISCYTCYRDIWSQDLLVDS